MSYRKDLRHSLVSVVLPLLDEAKILPRLIADIKRVMKAIGCGYEIILVNDGSTDGSGELLDAMAYSDRHLKVIHLSRNFGHQAAVQAGLDHASGNAVILMDSDGQDDPRAIRDMLRNWLRGDDVVYAVRFGRKEGLLKRSLFSAFYRLLDKVSNVPIPRDAGNFSLMDRRVVDLLKALPESDRYLPGLRSWVGFQQSSVRVERFARHDKKPRVSLAGLVRLAKNAIVGFSNVPLQAFYWIAGISAVVCFGSISYALVHRLITGYAVPGWASTTSITAFFGAMNALGIAILGEYVSRIYDQVRNRPSYIIDRTNIGMSLGNANPNRSQTVSAMAQTPPNESLSKDAEAEILATLESIQEESRRANRWSNPPANPQRSTACTT